MDLEFASQMVLMCLATMLWSWLNKSFLQFKLKDNLAEHILYFQL